MIICITGPSGSSKTIISALLEVKGFFRIVTSTTRKPRKNEPLDAYNFVEEITEDDYLCITEYADEIYGIDKKQIEELNPELNYVVVLDELGYEEIRELYKGKVYGFYLNILEDTALKRLKQRGDLPTDIALRLQADRELHRYDKRLDDSSTYDLAIFGDLDPYVIIRQIIDFINEQTESNIDEGEMILAAMKAKQNGSN